MSKQYHYFYIIVNKVNRKFYYGVHSTTDLNDGYMGSGTVLKAAIEKHGIENFKKTILGFFDTRDELLTVEREFVNEHFLESHKGECYNIAVGGSGASMTPEIAEKISNAKKGKPSTFKGHKHSPESIEKMKKSSVDKNKGHKHSPKTIEKIRSANIGEKNPMYGKPSPMKGKPGTFSGHKHSPEVIEKIREAAKRRWAAKKAEQIT